MPDVKSCEEEARSSTQAESKSPEKQSSDNNKPRRVDK